jgi:predicted nuclease of predicted toxin-antitoxin system
MRYAHKDKRVILTFDLDFGELTIKDRVYPSVGIILLRLHQMNPQQMAEYTMGVIRSRKDWEGHLSVIENDRVRMRQL